MAGVVEQAIARGDEVSGTEGVSGTEADRDAGAEYGQTDDYCDDVG